MKSKAILEQRLERTVSSFAYLYGSQSRRLRRMVREADFASARTVGYQVSSEETDAFALTRLIVGAEMDGNAFASLVNQGSRTIGGLSARAQACVYYHVLRGAEWRW